MVRAHRRLARRAGILAGWLLLAAGNAGFASLSCAGKQVAGKQTAVQEKPDTLTLAGLRESIARQVGAAQCSSPAVCRALAMGAKPCGGPRRYLVYAVSSTDSVRLAAEVTRYTQAEARMNKEKGLMSDCSVVTKPRVNCVAGRCVAQK